MITRLEPIWELETALDLINKLQPQVRKLDYHIALGGGVLNYGHSYKDLDLYFLSLDNGLLTKPSDVKLLKLLTALFGPMTDLVGEKYMASSVFRHKVKFDFEGRRIDAFII